MVYLLTLNIILMSPMISDWLVILILFHLYLILWYLILYLNYGHSVLSCTIIHFMLTLILPWHWWYWMTFIPCPMTTFWVGLPLSLTVLNSVRYYFVLKIVNSLYFMYVTASSNLLSLLHPNFSLLFMSDFHLYYYTPISHRFLCLIF